MSEMAVEITRFEIDPESEEQMLAARPGLVSAIRKNCPGLLDARLFRGDAANVWIDVWFWASLDEAESATEVARSLPVR